MPPLRARYAGLSHVGMIRKTNEDKFLIAELSKTMVIHSTTLAVDDETRLFSDVEGQLLVVADGMGGHAAGEVASELTTDAIYHHLLHTMPWFFRLHHEHEDDLHEVLTAAVLKCQGVIADEVMAHPEEEGMGTTLTIAYVLWPRMFVVHVGDSRCYLLRAGKLLQITHDQTLVQSFVDDGSMTKEAARESPYSNVLLSAIGHGTVEPEVYKTGLELGDAVLLCSDGLTDRLSDDEIAAIVLAHDSEQQACEALIDAANQAGGQDNITVIVSRYMPN